MSEKEKREDFVQCEGWRRHGGAFTLGPIQWKQCPSRALVVLKVIQDDGETDQPSCLSCWNEALTHRIEILEATPIDAYFGEPYTPVVDEEVEKMLVHALTRIKQKAESWHGRSDAPFWNLGDTAAVALKKYHAEKGDKDV